MYWTTDLVHLVYSRAMTRDPNIYENPDDFIPERWMPTDGKAPPLEVNKLVFGFGRQ